MDAACHSVGRRATLGREKSERTESATVCRQAESKFPLIFKSSQEKSLCLLYSFKERNGTESNDAYSLP